MNIYGLCSLVVSLSYFLTVPTIFLFIRQLISELTERHSPKLCRISGSK